ncbi:hypothetical protein EAG_14364 [Camponotus floridanus]|uniref:Uncharacterized protein n=1 Tax=Camponotus floridanus TaxID=104421 RepID=E2A307_CAMFO|nr:hypothetical protein EAG_00595 [Camponotus floridanus]EFN72181.1 hypothetical protein EAG_14364 [Camponotus floridanus]
MTVASNTSYTKTHHQSPSSQQRDVGSPLATKTPSMTTRPLTTIGPSITIGPLTTRPDNRRPMTGSPVIRPTTGPPTTRSSTSIQLILVDASPVPVRLKDGDPIRECSNWLQIQDPRQARIWIIHFNIHGRSIRHLTQSS